LLPRRHSGRGDRHERPAGLGLRSSVRSRTRPRLLRALHCAASVCLLLLRADRLRTLLARPPPRLSKRLLCFSNQHLPRSALELQRGLLHLTHRLQGLPRRPCPVPPAVPSGAGVHWTRYLHVWAPHPHLATLVDAGPRGEECVSRQPLTQILSAGRGTRAEAWGLTFAGLARLPAPTRQFGRGHRGAQRPPVPFTVSAVPGHRRGAGRP
jgi:hypothetical protein